MKPGSGSRVHLPANDPDRCDQPLSHSWARSAALFDAAIALANSTPCSPKTLTRAARDFAEGNPRFAIESGMAALRWLNEGFGYEVTSLDVHDAYSYTTRAAENAGCSAQIRERICALVGGKTTGRSFASQIICRDLGS